MMIGAVREGGKAARWADRLWIGLLLLGMLVVTGVEALRRRPDPAAPAVDGAVLQHRVDLDTADAAELQLLPGVGPALAGRIVAARAEGGPFASLDDCARRVRGIGPVRVREWHGRVVERAARTPGSTRKEDGGE